MRIAILDAFLHPAATAVLTNTKDLLEPIPTEPT
jgi:hypothetical protein